MVGENTSDYVFVDFQAEGARDDQCDSWTSESGIAALEFDDDPDEFLRWTFKPGLALRRL